MSRRKLLGLGNVEERDGKDVESVEGNKNHVTSPVLRVGNDFC
jgi:hypothetical protein